MHLAEEVEIVSVTGGALLDDARALVLAYGAWVGSHEGFEGALEAQGFEAEVASLPGDYAPPGGRLFVALVNGQAGGTVSLRTLEPGVGEIKRLFVAPGYRGMSLGNRLLDALVDEAQHMGLTRLRLDTLPFMQTAARQYRRMGFVERDPYTKVHLPGARYFELTLTTDEEAPVLETYRPGYAEAFARLNRAWLEEYFRVEPKDEAVFNDVEGQVIAPGGEIFFIRVGKELVGSCAVMRHAPGEYELSKMAVDAAWRGRGFGEWLVREAITFARSKQATRLYLLSDEILRDALRLYERAGFVRVPFPGATGYQRGDVMMEYPLG
ncbi:MAG: GNAT family N-acetyltransferase [Gemmatimonadetes bacterium]|nr:GNAT family N-acetyltransferase [Gemmatimonadota bacterium]